MRGSHHERRAAPGPSRAPWVVLALLLLVLAGAIGALLVRVLGLFEEPGPPRSLRDLAVVCREGRAHEQAAPYRGGAPHPAVVFGEGPSSWLTTAGEGRGEPAPEEIQVVACSSRVGRLSEEPAMACPYLSGHAVHYFAARYRVEVYEARTRRRLGDFTLDATQPHPCPVSEVFAEDEPLTEREFHPEDEAYLAGLAPFVAGR
ncbi:hypothetical protein D7294_07180 [Streptomyces hoynatensis]|uniref:Uncharacterized protein n=1 Tax=Streptomyces hoynatensis TaxID=1141874 RepID=A0A3A9ZAQ7_9ACTN|nr:hypothetical protein D7294_07180 [Streptomyces hoynatensis]